MAHWLIEHLRPEAALLHDAVVAAGGVAHRWSDDWWSSGRFPDTAGAPVVFHGSLGNAARIQAAGRWKPGAFCDTAGLHYSAWARRLAGMLVNDIWRLTTVRALVADPAGIATSVGAEGRLFVRPDSPLKPFSGRVLSADSISLAALDHGFYYDDDALPIIVAPAQPVGREWRCVVAHGAVIAISGYEAEGREGHVTTPSAAVAGAAARLASRVAVSDPVVIMDIAETDMGLRVLELNPFSGADLYGCSRAAVVEAVHQVLA